MSDNFGGAVPQAKSHVKVPAALRTLELLQTLGRNTSPMTAQALATKIGIPRSSVYQLLEVLQTEGFVVHFPEERRWALGLSAFELGSAYLRHDPLERLAQPLLNRLLIDVGSLRSGGLAAVVQLGVLHGAELLYLLKGTTQAHNQNDLQVVTDIGVRLPAHLTASGRALLAQHSKAQLRAIYPAKSDAPLLRRTDSGPASFGELVALLDAEKKQGFSVETGEVSADYGSVAAAASNHLGLPAAAFAVTFRTDRITAQGLPLLQEHISQLVVNAAKELSKRLGSK